MSKRSVRKVYLETVWPEETNVDEIVLSKIDTIERTNLEALGLAQ